MGNLTKYPEPLVFGLDIGTRSIVGTIGYKENDKFNIVAQAVKFHDTRAMLDGQIHDIGKVGEEISYIKAELERQLDGRKLKDVCIAAAGRVLKTAVGIGEYEFAENTVVNQEYIHSLELIGVEKAHNEVNAGESIKYYCVGYTVIKYYLNDYEMKNLEGHKANKIGADVLATFLPEEVVDGLYAAVELAGLEVANLTLEPIATINVAIPEQFRLLNIALVDVGAGTSDICITSDSSIIGYGMIPMAGDEITEDIVKKYLVEFKVAEKIKMIGQNKKSMSYKDIMGISHKITPAEVEATVEATVEKITKSISDKIIELNGGKPVSAVFVVGGGGKIVGFTEALAHYLKLNDDRVALRGEEVLRDVNIYVEDVKKDPLLVTPIGICLNFYDQKNNFIFVTVNNERVKLYNNSKLTVFDAAIQYGLSNDMIFPKRGDDITYKVNGKTKIIRGQSGEAAIITINEGSPVGLNQEIEANDKINIQVSTAGKAASKLLGNIPEFSNTINFLVNGKEITCPKFAMVNGALESEYYEIKDMDVIEILNYYTLEQLLTFMDVEVDSKVYINNELANVSTKVYENFKIGWSDTPSFSELEEDEAYMTLSDEKEKKLEDIEITNNTIIEDSTTKDTYATLTVIINSKQVLLTGKTSYVFVDIFDFYSFDLTTVRGSELIMTIDGVKADHFSPLHNGAVIELYWKE